MGCDLPTLAVGFANKNLHLFRAIRFEEWVVTFRHRATRCSKLDHVSTIFDVFSYLMPDLVRTVGYPVSGCVVLER